VKLTVCIFLVTLAGSVQASPRPKPLEAERLYHDARRECRKPGLRIAAFMKVYFDHWLSPRTFGARVLRTWDQLTADQQARFEELAETKLLAPERERMIRAFCDKRDKYLFVLETASEDPADSTRITRYQHVMVQHHVGDGSFRAAWVLIEQGGRWSLARVGAPSFGYPGIDDDPVSAPLRVRLAGADLDEAMRLLATTPSAP
jgi:hypothetical protein